LFYVGIICYYIINGLEPSFYAPNGIWFKHFFLTVFFMHGWYPDTINAIVPGGWSIATEMTFYLVVPILFSKIKSYKTTLSILFLSILFAKFFNVLSWSYFNSLFENSQDLVYAFQNWWFIGQFPVFLIGILLFQTIKQISKYNIDKQYGDVLLLLSLLLFVSFLKTKTFFDLITPNYFYAFAFYFFALSLYIKPNLIFVNSLTKIIGKYSYSLYITHFAVLTTMKYFLPNGLNFNSNVSFVLGMIIVVFISFLLSFITFHLIETPGINLGKKIISKIK
jgi:peptidoglycan/LPS O-acetylase OafA/YrhL